MPRRHERLPRRGGAVSLHASPPRQVGGALLVELEGEPTDDQDFDADEGALLIKPTRVVDVREPDWDRIEEL